MTEKSSKLSYDIAKIYKKYLLRDPDREGLNSLDKSNKQ